ncbi:hypothetical protein BDP27DRAFT_1431484 [Rhodocollybia butyracea]|uniref:Uncharacterized protein n=1 Tax=Rhodocollybia butyracea TaxID=206335 RepID=A0A9P5P8P8_9AGAR|nr:hypothetical protein BDP27DRAFT_1431484 [Rhodocollybia butyracea]
MFRLTTVLLLVQTVMIAQGLPEPRTESLDSICGWGGQYPPYCAPGYTCCGPLRVINGTTYGRHVFYLERKVYVIVI